MKYKRCSKCGEVKPITEFYRDKTSKDGYCYCCKRCKLVYAKKYNKEHKQEVIERNKKYREEHREEITKQSKKYYEENKEKRTKYSREYAKNNKDKIAERKKRYRKENIEKISEYQKKYREEHRDELLAKARARRLQNNRTALTQDELDFLLEELDYNENVQQQPMEKRNDQGSHLTQEELDFLLDII